MLLNIDTLISFRFFSWSIPNSLLCPCVFWMLFCLHFYYTCCYLGMLCFTWWNIFMLFFYLVLLVMLSRHQFFLVIFLLAVKVRWLNYVWKIQLIITYLTWPFVFLVLFYFICYVLLHLLQHCFDWCNIDMLCFTRCSITYLSWFDPLRLYKY